MKVKVPIYGTAPAKATYVEQGATVGAQIGVNLLMPSGKVGTLAQLQALFGSSTTGDTNTSNTINTTDDLDEGRWHLWFTERRAQDAVGGILTDTSTIDLVYTGGSSITATLKDLADSGTGTSLVKITRDAKGRISGTSAATTTDLTEGDNLYFTDERAQDAAGAALDGTGDVPLTYDDAGNKISAALSADVLASLALADSATQPGDLATVATTGAYADLSGLPTLGTAAATDATDYATAAQGALADSAVQPGDLGTAAALNVPASGDAGPAEVVLGNDSRLGGGGGSGDVVGPASAVDGDLALFDGITGKLIKSGGALATSVRSVALTGLSLATSAVIAATDTVLQAFGKLQAQITDNLLPAGYIDGLQMVWVSGTALTVTSGAAYIPGSSKVLRVTSDIAKTGLSLSASTWYHVYLYDNSGTPDVEIVATAPAAAYNGTARSKTGDASRRYVGSALTNSSGALLNFLHNTQSGFVTHLVTTANAPFRIVSNGQASGARNVSTAGVSPVTALQIYVRLVNLISAPAGDTLFVSNPDYTPTVSASAYIISIAGSGGEHFVFHPVSTSQLINYFLPGTATSGGVYMDVFGYTYVR